MIDNSKYIEKTFLSPDELVPSSQKTKTLNLISEKLDSLTLRTEDSTIKSLIAGLRHIIADAYVISMYKFQFRILTTSIEKEIDSIEQMVEHAE